LTLTGLIREALQRQGSFEITLALGTFRCPLCMISFTTLGAVLARIVHFDRLLITYVIVFGSRCLASYSFDELKRRPLRTINPPRTNFGCWDELVHIDFCLLPLLSIDCVNDSFCQGNRFRVQDALLDHQSGDLSPSSRPQYGTAEI